MWDAALAAPEWDRAPVWFHGDLLPGNVLVEDGRVRAVIDFGGLGVGDPACDVMIAWGLFTGASRAAFRSALEVDDAMWARARGHTLSQAAMFVPYYADTNPLGVARAPHDRRRARRRPRPENYASSERAIWPTWISSVPA